jgi:hypothetical protein
MLGGHAGSWLRLTWAAPVTLSRVVLHDRPNLNDRVTSARLQLSDGTTVSIGSLPNDGSPLTITLPGHPTTISLLFTVRGISRNTHNVGLAEIEAWGTAPPPR